MLFEDNKYILNNIYFQIIFTLIMLFYFLNAIFPIINEIIRRIIVSI